MTCIIGLIENDVVYIGADSAGVVVSHHKLRIRKDKKMFEKDGFLVGYTDSYRMGQIIQYEMPFPQMNEETCNPHEFMVTQFVKALRESLQLNGWLYKKDEREDGGTFLVGFKYCNEPHLFTICNDFQVAESTLPFQACGSGEECALASMWENYLDMSIPPEEKITRALRCASQFNITVAPPFHVLSI